MNINRLNFVNPANVTGLVTTKGDLITTTTGTGLTRLPIGTDGQILVAESTEPTGFEWIDQGSFTDAQFTIVGTNSNFVFDASNLTAERTLTIQDKSGILANNLSFIY